MMGWTRIPLLLLLLLFLFALQLAGGIDIGVLQAENGVPKKQQTGSKGRGSLLLGSLTSGGAPAGGRLLREGLAPPVTALPFDKGELKRIAHQLSSTPSNTSLLRMSMDLDAPAAVPSDDAEVASGHGDVPRSVLDHGGEGIERAGVSGWALDTTAQTAVDPGTGRRSGLFAGFDMGVAGEGGEDTGKETAKSGDMGLFSSRGGAAAADAAVDAAVRSEENTPALRVVHDERDSGVRVEEEEEVVVVVAAAAEAAEAEDEDDDHEQALWGDSGDETWQIDGSTPNPKQRSKLLARLAVENPPPPVYEAFPLGGGTEQDFDEEAEPMSDGELTTALPDLGFGLADGRRLRARKAAPRDDSLKALCLSLAQTLFSILSAMASNITAYAVLMHRAADRALLRGLSYMDVIAGGGVTWRAFLADMAGVVEEGLDTCRDAARCIVRGVGSELQSAVGESAWASGTKVCTKVAPMGRVAGIALRWGLRRIEKGRMALVGYGFYAAQGAAKGVYRLSHGQGMVATVGSTMAGFVKSMFGEGEMGARLRELDMRLRKIDLEQEDVKGDGNCFYHALVKQLQRHEIDIVGDDRGQDEEDGEDGEEEKGLGGQGADWLAAAARAQVVSHMRRHPDAFNHSVETGENYETYLSRMSKNGEWAGELEMVAAAARYRCRIACYAVTPGGLVEYQYGEGGDNILRLCLYKSHFWSTAPRVGEILEREGEAEDGGRESGGGQGDVEGDDQDQAGESDTCESG